MLRDLLIAVERVKERDGVHVAGLSRQLALQRLDSMGNAGEAIVMLREALEGASPEGTSLGKWRF